MFDQFRALSVQRQLLLTGLVAGAIGISLIAAWFLLFHTTYRPLFTDLRTSDAATIVADLDQKKIPYRLADGGATILVPDDQVDTTRLSVMSEALPLKGTVGFELFNKSDFGLTDFAQKINYQRALQGELERTIMTLDDVDSARVNLSLGEDRLFRDDRVPAKASATIHMKKGKVLSDSAAQGVRRLIAAAVPNLDVSDVVILDEEGRPVSAAPQVAASAEPAAPLVEEKRAIEEFYEAHIRQALIDAHFTDFGVGVLADVAADDANQRTGLSDWSPNNRKFPLQVTLSPTTHLEPAGEDSVRFVVATAIGSNQGQQDIVAFGPIPAAVATRTTSHAPHIDRNWIDADHFAGRPIADDDRGDWLLEIALSAIMALAALIAIIFALRRLRGPRRLTGRQREDFAARLSALLDQEDGRVASRS